MVPTEKIEPRRNPHTSESNYSGSDDVRSERNSRSSLRGSNIPSSTNYYNGGPVTGVERPDPPAELYSLWKLAKQADVDGYGLINVFIFLSY
jgi:hypothetical protein